MSMRAKFWMLVCAAVALAAAMTVGTSQPAKAQFGISIGGFPIGINIGGGYRGRYGRGKRGAKRDGGSEGEDPRPGRGDKVAVSKGAPSSAEQMNVLRFNVASTAVAAAAGSTKDLFEVGQTTSNEADRDYTAKIEAIIGRFEKAQRDANNDDAGDITMNAIEQSLEKAFKEAKLERFGRFAGESWTAERVRKMILDLVDAELPRLFRGNSRGTAPMSALDTLIQRAAASVYRRIFETSELLAANRSSALFMQRLYQAHGRLVKDDLLESADGIIMRAALGVIRPYEPSMRRAENSWVYRYRAQRIVFDCLSEDLARTSSSETGILETKEIEERIQRRSAAVCIKWLQNQFEALPTDARPNPELAPQTPAPLRAVWGEKGPKDNPAMYNNSVGTF